MSNALSPLPAQLQPFFQQLHVAEPESHKGQNGKLLIIGGSELFHAASKWSLDIASKFVDMVFYSSIPANNELIQQAKGEFWNGIVIPREEITNYVQEADAILIGPGMTRSDETQQLTNQLLTDFPYKKWVIDAGALQMVDVKLITDTCILTPHEGELKLLYEKTNTSEPTQLSAALNGALLLIKAHVDRVVQGSQIIEVVGGNAGMTKGGTGDVLAGLVAGLYACNDTLVSAVVGSWTNKRAGDLLYKEVGPNFNASDLVSKIPAALWEQQKYG